MLKQYALYRFLCVIIFCTSFNSVTGQAPQQLIDAATKGDSYTVDQLLKLNYDVNQTDKDGFSALMRAAINGHITIVEKLLAHNDIDVNQIEKNGFSALIMAVQCGHSEIVKELLSHKDININLANIYGDTALIWACVKGHAAIVEMILAHKDVDVNQTNKDGFSALTLAASNGYPAIVKMLLTHKDIDVNQTNKNGNTALILAAQNGHCEVVQSLLRHKDINVNQANLYSDTALIWACVNGHAAIVEMILAHKDIDVNQTNKDGLSALMLAASNGYPEIVKMLLAYKDIDVNQTNKDGFFALMLAASNGYPAIVKMLLAHKDIDVNQTNKNGLSALMLAALNNRIAVIENLLAHKDIDVNQTEKNNFSALMLAAHNGYNIIVEKLLAHKDINVRQVTKCGLSALLLAQYEEHKQVIKKFFKNKRFFETISRPPFKKSCYLTLTTNDHNNAIIRNFISALFERSIAVASTYILKEGLCTFAPYTLHLFASGDWTLFLNKSRTLGVVVPYRIIKDGLYNNYGFKGLKRIKQENVIEELFNLTISNKVTSDTLIDEFRNIIDITNENHPTRFILDGHGFTDYSIANILLSSFGKFLGTLKEIEAEFLLISTCFAGGKNLLFIQKKINELVKQQNSTKKYSGNKFLNNFYIVLTSTNEATSGGLPNIHILFNQLTTFFKNRTSKIQPEEPPQTNHEIDTTFTSIIKSSVLIGNASSIASARMPGEHTFFRAPDLGNMKIITYEELQNLKNLRNNMLEITIEPNVKYVQIYPCDAADFTFVVEGQEMPAFISKIPGRGSHFLGKIIYTSSEQDIEQAIRNCIKKGFLQLIEENAIINANTCWFINELILKIGSRTIILNKLIIFIGPDTYKWIYKLDGHLYYYHAQHLVSQNTNKPSITHEKSVEIDELTFRWKMRDYAYDSFASEEALIEATGGNENRATTSATFVKFYNT